MKIIVTFLAFRTVKPIEAIPRPKGLGLGADRSLQRQKEHSNKPREEEEKDDNEKLKLCLGTHCQVTSGKHTDLYGIVRMN